MSKVWDWIKARRERNLTKYEEAKKDFERVIGRPSIEIVLELPPSMEDLKAEFQSLKDDEEFISEVVKLAERYLRSKYGRQE
ncbi:hypothetical protein DRO55_01705 [Candidatus Bathyarchaeota archaeon]|nr:MAG: hypothetical protein DRO55_01705 [Candidatus Bathyarchaeota archaeon]